MLIAFFSLYAVADLARKLLGQELLYKKEYKFKPTETKKPDANKPDTKNKI